ncbi:MAG: acylphosphatase, partial [Pseudomonadota bacterium]
HETVYFSGRVQGVGFRFQVLQAAKGFDVAGFVRNLDVGRVLLEAEGEAREVEAFVAAIGEQMYGYVRQTERLAARRAGQFQGFSIR